MGYYTVRDEYLEFGRGRDRQKRKRRGGGGAPMVTRKRAAQAAGAVAGVGAIGLAARAASKRGMRPMLPPTGGISKLNSSLAIRRPGLGQQVADRVGATRRAVSGAASNAQAAVKKTSRDIDRKRRQAAKIKARNAYGV